MNQEENFHDAWAQVTDPKSVLVRESFEACTAPENRWILSQIGDLKGKRILDIGSGLGEAAVYFALHGAHVTALDLSSEMLGLATEVATLYGVTIQTVHAAIEDAELAPESFDIIYAANVLHHVNISQTLEKMYRLLVPEGLLVSWDPLAHNPVINVYRWIARAVRTPGEHPLRIEQLSLFKGCFREVRWKTFWCCSLLVFLRFFLWEWVSPSKVRYWKKIITDAERLRSFYLPLERIDTALLARFPLLERYCWNIVVICKK